MRCFYCCEEVSPLATRCPHCRSGLGWFPERHPGDRGNRWPILVVLGITAWVGGYPFVGWILLGLAGVSLWVWLFGADGD